jgi:hypothetical protein
VRYSLTRVMVLPAIASVVGKPTGGMKKETSNIFDRNFDYNSATGIFEVYSFIASAIPFKGW